MVASPCQSLASFAAGPSPRSVSRSAQAGKYINDPNVTARSARSTVTKIFVTGRVATTQLLAARAELHRQHRLAGGLTDADAKNITVLRKGEGQAQVLKFNYRDVAKGKNLDQNVVLLPGDTVVVP
jgi:polysaccharide export outer membrane protein